jgi:hypothetical protein
MGDELKGISCGAIQKNSRAEQFFCGLMKGSLLLLHRLPHYKIKNHFNYTITTVTLPGARPSFYGRLLFSACCPRASASPVQSAMRYPLRNPYKNRSTIHQSNSISITFASPAVLLSVSAAYSHLPRSPSTGRQQAMSRRRR